MMVVTLHVSHGFDILSILADFMCLLLQHNGACGYLACVKCLYDTKSGLCMLFLINSAYIFSC